MSAVVFNAIAPQSSVNQGFYASGNPSLRLTRRARLARTLVVASLAVVMAAGLAAQSGAGDRVVAATSYATVVVPAGATLWSVASAYSDGDIQAMVEAIREANNLPGYDIAAGARLRVPSK
ncbi:MAG: LysM peptidoglycan-binding domain-containing protein [Candidatus Planktophila sp.]|nr:LysM peptidoglycan-binding domain-containing protein [Candidatus Planktophila sp.]